MVQRVKNENNEVMYFNEQVGEWMPDYQATMIEQGGPVSNVIRGAGRTFKEWGRGLGLVEEADPFEEQAFQQLQEAAPITTGVGQALPYVASAMAFGPTVAGQAGGFAGLGAATTQGGLAERGQAAVTEGLLAAGGAATFNMAGRIFNRLRNIRGGAGVAKELAEAGGKVTPGQALGSRALMRAEAPLQSMGILESAAASNQGLLQRTVGRALGMADDAIDLTPVGLGQAADDIGARINQAVYGKSINVSGDIAERLAKVKKTSEFIDFPKLGPKMTGTDYQAIRSQLAGVARAEARAATKTPGKLEYVNTIIDDLDQAFINTVGDAAARNLQTARSQWRNLLAVERGKALTTEGTVNAPSLWSALNQTLGKTARRGGRGRLDDATQSMLDMARIQSAPSLRPMVGESGTAVRMGAGLGPMALGAAGGGYLGGDVQSAGLGALAGLGLRYGYVPMGQMIGGRMAGSSQLGGGLGAALLDYYRDQED